MQAFASAPLQFKKPFLPVLADLEAAATSHRAQNANDAVVIPALFDHLRNQSLFALSSTHMLDADVLFDCHLVHVRNDLQAQRVGKQFFIIEKLVPRTKS